MSTEDCVPKLIGGDIELGNFILGETDNDGKSDREASRLLLDEVDGLPLRRTDDRESDSIGSHSPGAASHSFWGGSYGSSFNAQDWGRKYLATNGGCIYIDLNHLELATPEVLSARDHQAVWAAMLRIARDAQIAVNADLPPDRRAVVLVNNSDRQGHSYGAHQSFLMSRVAWDGMIRERMLPAIFFLMAYQVSSIVFTGQGKAGSENGRPRVPFQISQRADFMETLVGEQTTFHRPIINTRDEPLCGPRGQSQSTPLPGSRYARLHVIFYDANLAPVATYLKVGVMQLILTMIEAGYIDDSLLLKSPLQTLHCWSRDIDLGESCPLMSGETLTAVELQLRFLEQAREFDARHGFAEFVPESTQILDLWEDTLMKLHARDFPSLRGRLDWLMKRALLEQALKENPDWEWDSAEITYLDQIYSSIDPANSLFLPLEAEGLIEPVATEDEISRFVAQPPEDTRAWTRAMLLRAAGRDRVTSVDWDRIELDTPEQTPGRISIPLPDPLGATRSDVAPAFAEAMDFSALLTELPRVGIDARARTNYFMETAVSLLDHYGIRHS